MVSFVRALAFQEVLLWIANQSKSLAHYNDYRFMLVAMDYTECQVCLKSAGACISLLNIVWPLRIGCACCFLLQYRFL